MAGEENENVIFQYKLIFPGRIFFSFNKGKKKKADFEACLEYVRHHSSFVRSVLNTFLLGLCSAAEHEGKRPRSNFVLRFKAAFQERCTHRTSPLALIRESSEGPHTAAAGPLAFKKTH